MSHPLEHQIKKRATILAFIGNLFLFVLKLILGIFSGSIAVVSDALHSLMDIIATITLAIGVKIGSEQADEEHPFGHHRAEPIAGLIIAVIAGILAFEVARESVVKFFVLDREIVGTYAITALVITIIIKLIMSWYFRRLSKKIHSGSIRALAIDSKNDVLATGAALVGVVIASFGLTYFDSIAGLIVAIFIFKGGYEIGVENIDYLMGKTADEETIKSVRLTALQIRGVQALNTLRTHYVGNKIHVEIHIEVDHQMSTGESHEIAEEVEAALENIPEIAKAFVHVDPIVVSKPGNSDDLFHQKYPDLK